MKKIEKINIFVSDDVFAGVLLRDLFKSRSEIINKVYIEALAKVGREADFSDRRQTCPRRCEDVMISFGCDKMGM